MQAFEIGNFVKQWGKTITDIASKDRNIVVIDADLAKASGSYPFRDAFPERHFNMGIAEQDMVSFAAGLADCGKTPFVISFGIFLTSRAGDQMINCVAYNHSNVKFIGMGAGLTCAKNGGTHMSINDVSVARSIPGMSVFDPADTIEFDQVVRYAATTKGPMFIRSNRGELPVIHKPDYVFDPARAELIRVGTDITLITSGITTANGIIACEALSSQGISVEHIHVPCIKPLDIDTILSSISKTGKAVVCENHSILGGLGGAVTEVVCEHAPAPVYRLGLRDVFGETADLPYLCEKYEIDAKAICKTINTVMGKQQ